MRKKIPIIPYGAGSGVSGGTIATHGGIIVDMKKMRKILKLDEENLIAEVEGGMMSMHLENELQRKGYTLGHFPSSIICASLGGCLAARSAGQCSTRYGKIEDMTLGLEVVTGRGDIVETHTMANAAGIDFNQIFLGSEGTLGLITKAKLRICPLPPAKLYRGVKFTNFKTAIEAIRRMMQSGLKPSVVRLYDEIDTMLFKSHKKSGKQLFSMPSPIKKIMNMVHDQALKTALYVPDFLNMASKMIPSGCMLILIFEGHEAVVNEEQKLAMKIAKDLGAVDLGEAPARSWEERRYSVSYKASGLFESGLFTDTIEVATTWDKLYTLYHEISRSLSSYALVMAHLSHVYNEGGGLYFTIVAPLIGLNRTEELYDAIWDRAMKTTQKVGGVISHHHGVGRLKAKYMEEEWGAGSELFQYFKKFFDPQGIMNPSKLYDANKGKKLKVTN